MQLIEQAIISLLLNFVSIEQLNTFFSDPQNVAIVVGVLVSVSGAILGTFLLLRKLSMTSDAISHTVLLGIVVAFIIMVSVFGLEPDISSPWLILGAAAAGVVTVILTEIIQRSNLVKADASLGLAFPFLFAIAIILISKSLDNVHLDEDAVMVGEIGVAWANTNSYCYDNCDDLIITPDHPLAQSGRQCINCASEDISPRSPDAIFEDICSNCGTYTAAEAWRDRLIDEPPVLVFFPKAVSVLLATTLINIGFVTLLYKELKISTFDSALASTLGFHPAFLHYGLMIMVSVTAVAAFDAVGSVLVVAFFVIPPATAYLLTDRLAWMFLISPFLGGIATVLGYDLARGNFLGFEVNRLLELLDNTIGLNGYTDWNTSISASMVMMMFFIFLVVWIVSPRYGLVSTLLRRRWQRQAFATQLLMGHLYHHEGEPDEDRELAIATLHEHLNWTPAYLQRILLRARALNLVKIENNLVYLTPRGLKQATDFMAENLVGDNESRYKSQVPPKIAT